MLVTRYFNDRLDLGPNNISFYLGGSCAVAFMGSKPLITRYQSHTGSSSDYKVAIICRG